MGAFIVAVIAREARSWSDCERAERAQPYTPDDKQLVAYYTASGSEESEEEAVKADRLRTHVLGRLPEYMLPAAIPCLPWRSSAKVRSRDSICALALGYVPYGPTLTSHINPDIPVYGLAGPDISQKPFVTFRKAAERFIKLIREVQPEGPYRLAGRSLAGALAYEVATLLIGMDQTVEFLGMIDTYCPDDRQSLISRSTWKRLSDIDAFLQLTDLFEMNSGCSCRAFVE